MKKFTLLRGIDKGKTHLGETGNTGFGGGTGTISLSGASPVGGSGIGIPFEPMMQNRFIVKFPEHINSNVGTSW